MARLIQRWGAIGVFLTGATAWAACSSGGGGTRYNQLYLTAAEIAVAEHETAYDVLTKHRRLIVSGSAGVLLKGGDDREGFTNEYSSPVIIIDGDKYVTNPLTELRQIPVADVVAIRLYFASQVPPEYRVPGWQGGAVEVTTRRGPSPD